MTEPGQSVRELYGLWDPPTLSDYGGAGSYEYLRDVALLCFNPPDDDGAEECIVADAIVAAAEFIEEAPCCCTPATIEDNDPCRRCRLLGRLGDRAVAR